MRWDNPKCDHCNAKLSEQWLPFSRHHAIAFSKDHTTALMWCRQCGHISTYRSRWRLWVFQTRNLHFVKAIPIASFFYSGEARSGEMTPIYNELLRLIWHALKEAAQDQNVDDVELHATCLGLDALPASEVGAMMAIVCHTRRLVHLEQILATNTYSSDDGPFLWDFETWLSSYPDQCRAKAAMEKLREYDKVLSVR